MQQQHTAHANQPIYMQKIHDVLAEHQMKQNDAYDRHT